MSEAGDLLSKQEIQTQSKKDFIARLREFSVQHKKALTTAKTFAVLVPALACGYLSTIPSLIDIVHEMKAGANQDSIERFDPSMGATLEPSAHHRALVVVHEGFARENDPFHRYDDNPAYDAYLATTNARIEQYKQDGDLVVIAMQFSDFEQYTPIPDPHTLYYITRESNGFPDISLISNGVVYSQDVDRVFDALRQLGVTNIEVAGEMRGACPVQVEASFKREGFITNWSDCCLWPQNTKAPTPTPKPNP